MADFCKQCAIRIFGEDNGDMADLLTEDEAAQGLCVSVLCEGCGPIRVDREGNCLEFDCMRKGHSDSHRQWVTEKTGRTES